MLSEKTTRTLMFVIALLLASAYARLAFELRQSPVGRRVYFDCAPGTTAPEDRTRAPFSVPDELRVDPNTAGTEELQTVPGIGPATARAIEDSRKRDGAFASLDELTRVRGIGKKKLENLRLYLIIKDRHTDATVNTEE